MTNEHLDAEAKRLQQRINDLFKEWQEDPSNFTFCQTVRSMSAIVERGDRSVPRIDDGRAMLEEIAGKACGGRWQYEVHSMVGKGPVCLLTRYDGL